MKRPREDGGSGSDLEDRGCSGSPRSPRSPRASPLGPPTSSSQLTRKRRRGIIEKRRRDRINTSLLELRRLVPTTLEKQGSAKLEKAEILQMTVDHLKMLQSSGGRGHLDVLSLDFLSLGFRECVTEVSRYLDPGDPLRPRLLTHLTCCAAQRDAAAAMAAAALQHQAPPPPVLPHHWAAVATLRPAPYLPVPPASPDAQRGSAFSPADSAPLSFLSLSASFPIALHGGFPVFPPSAGPPGPAPQTHGGKPYRPWGTEVGAF
ncbi:hairy/enhancer-of-split related with YRPW motif protein 2-like isoform X2 [Cololabis saira]|nr:hairy/enhancer-of-split related with YRPW motif protein 2-like isoform X2 [Cololabis saira]